MSLEEALANHTVALKENTAILERVVAGQQAAIEKIDGKVGAPAGKPAAAKPTPAAAAPAAAAPAPAAAAPAADPAIVTDDQVKAAAVTWMDGKTKEEKGAAAVKLNEMLDHFGRAGEKLTGPESKLSDDERKQARFYVQRWAAGLTVDFNAEYDFDGDPTQGGAAENDPLG